MATGDAHAATQARSVVAKLSCSRGSKQLPLHNVIMVLALLWRGASVGILSSPVDTVRGLCAVPLSTMLGKLLLHPSHMLLALHFFGMCGRLVEWVCLRAALGKIPLGPACCIYEKLCPTVLSVIQ